MHAVKYRLKITFILISVFCLLEAINLLSGRVLNQFGIMPRDSHSLAGIILTPLLHLNVQHFISNISTLTVFIFFCLQFGIKSFGRLSIFVVLVSGTLIWLFGRSGLHLGASALLYGYFGFLLIAGWLSKQFILTVISILVALLYGSIIWGVLPTQAHVSWEGHLFGLIAGVLFAWFWRQALRPPYK